MATKTKIPKRWIINDLGFDVPITKNIQEEQIRIFLDKPENSKPIGEINSSIIMPLANLHLNAKFLFTKDEIYKKYIVDYINKNEPSLKEFFI